MGYTMRERTLPLDDSWDVVVVGGGPSGCTAAAAAAREDARTLLIETTGCLGGMGTSGLVPAWCPFSDGEKMIYRGLAEKVLLRSNAGTYGAEPDALNWVPIDPENLKVVYDDLVSGFGVTVLFNTQAAGVEMTAPGEAGVLLLSSKQGLTAVKARVYVDCSGDGDVAAWAGAGFVQGDGTGELQPATHCFAFGNVDLQARKDMPRLHGANPQSPIHDIIASGKYPLIPDAHICNNPVGPGSVGFNAGHLWSVDNTDPVSVSRALPQGRKMALEFLKALSESQPRVFGNAYVSQTGALLGIRETRRIIGDYCLTIDDFKGLKSFEDEIGRNCYFIDVHHKQSDVGTGNEGAKKEHIRLNKGESHGIPYRCLTPKGLTNILVAGRCVSSDRAVNGSVRVMPVCLVTGEAAGIAAALAAKSEAADVHAIDTALLRKRLQAEGAYLPPVT